MAAVPPNDPLVGALLTRCSFPPAGTEVTCAVSGGPDSTALLVLAVAAGCEVEAVHVDHGLRPGSAAEAELVGETATLLGARSRSVEVVVEAGPGLEERARRARHAALPAEALFGHTADDQAETVLLNLMRGAGIDGLAGMRAGLRHPILGLRRAETHELCRHLGLATVDDPTNTDPAMRRNRVRHELLPLLDDIASRDIVPLLVRTADWAREASDHLQAEAASVDPTDCRALSAAPRAVARTALRAWLRSCSADGHPPDAASLERVLAVARGGATATDIGRGWRVRRSQMRLHLVPPAATSGTGHGRDGTEPL